MSTQPIPTNNQLKSLPAVAPVPLDDATIELLRHVEILASLDDQGLHCLDGGLLREIETDEVLIKQGELYPQFWMLLRGSMNVYYSEPDGAEMTVYIMESGGSFGEITLLASVPAPANIRAAEPCLLLELNEEQFWSLLNRCTEVRRAILANMAKRLAKVQSANFQQEKMISLGTLAAGLMHELNNPGTAARRASTQLRENLMRMHALTAKFSRTELTADQRHCMYDLQDYALSERHTHTLTSIEQADAEEALTEWMESVEIEDAWKLAPALVSAGIQPEHLQCARSSFSGSFFSDALNWLEALISSMSLVGIIEESIGRVTDLVKAVKSYAYEGSGQKMDVDVNQSIHATIVILGHKLREKQIALDKSLAPNLPVLHTRCQGLNQIWTNLLDNAIDASPQSGRIGLKTWTESFHDQPHICISVCDHGSGVPLESQPHIFDPFYTTKPVGIGTGLGLGIVHRIVEQIGGQILFSSVPGETEFVVRLPASYK